MSDADAKNAAELDALQGRVASLSDSFAAAYGGMVNSMQQSVAMMRNMNDLLERYVLSCVACGQSAAATDASAVVDGRSDRAAPHRRQHERRPSASDCQQSLSVCVARRRDLRALGGI